MNKLFISVLVLTLMSTSCSESFLDKEPLDQIVESNFYKTEADAIEALVAVYDAVGFQSSPNVAWSPTIMVADILSDDSFGGGADANDGFVWNQLNNHAIQTTNPVVHALWLKNYAGIFRANQFLERLPDIDASDEFFTRTEAEAKFLRAHFHLELVRLFENIIVVPNTLSGPSEFNIPQSTPQETYNFIAGDLLDAIEGLPEIIPQNETGRVSKWAAQGLLARAFLFFNGVYAGNMEANGVTVDAQRALADLEDIIANSGYELLESYNDIFRISGEFGAEAVFEIPHGDNPAWFDWGYLRGAEGNLASQMQGPRVTGSQNWDRGWSFGVVSQDLVNAIGNDPRLDDIILNENIIDGNLIKGFQHTGYFSNKYSSDAEHWGANGQFEHNRTTNNRVIRFADILLMAAELGSPNAQEYMDRVRARAGLPSIPVTVDNIYAERRIEFALEGIRYFDILRRGLDFAEQEITESGLRGDGYTDAQMLYDRQFRRETRGFLPIPQTEIDLSAGTLVQNAGY